MDPDVLNLVIDYLDNVAAPIHYRRSEELYEASRRIDAARRLGRRLGEPPPGVDASNFRIKGRVERGTGDAIREAAIRLRLELAKTERVELERYVMDEAG